jgi:hypothetical protein
MEKIYQLLSSQKEFLIRLFKKHFWFYQSEKNDKRIDQLFKINQLFKEIKISENNGLITKDESSFLKKKLLEFID